MPPLKRPDKEQTLCVPSSEALLAADVDVLVVGAGPAGVGAALGAARAGGKVVLVERYGFVGGAATVGLVMPLMSAHTQESKFRRPGFSNLFPTDHGYGIRVIAGVLVELVERMVKNGGAVLPSIETGYVVPFDPEILKITVMEMLDEADVGVLLHSVAFAFSAGEQSSTVFFHTKSGPVAIRAKCVIDSTGDGDIAAMAGAPYEIGRDHDGLAQPMTLYFRMVGFERPAFAEYVRMHPEQWYGVFGLWNLIEKASDEGKLRLPREDLLMFSTPHEQEVSVNSTRVIGKNAIDVFDLSSAEWESRFQAHNVSEFLKMYVPGFSNSYMVQTGLQIGIREARRIIGEYILTGEDVIEVRKFPDVIARCSYPIDIHNPKGKGTRIERLPAGEAYDIPLRCLFPKNTRRLLTAGRCISGTHEAHSSYRIMPAAMATGQAAGVCASLAAKTSSDVREVNYKDVQKELLRQKANLGENSKI
ncbi:MAG: FAD-dependent oxidoreductase [Fibrobacter sp.]|nr:FAD-dependent oxidoreductase [Fibrobacter sp.]